MITPPSSSGSTSPTPPPPGRRSVSPEPVVHQETLSTDHAARLHAALARTPEIRSDEVARASHLAVDPLYPPRAIIDEVARLIADSNDVSENQD